MTTNPTTPAPGVLPPPRWAVRATHVVAWSTVPSGVWRIALVLGVPVGVMEREKFLAGSPRDSPLIALAYVLRSARSPRPPRTSRSAWYGPGARSSRVGISAGEALFVASYAPLLLWGPLLAAVTWSYHRRHRVRGGGAARRRVGSE
ncbi:hypothetical protein [Streptomyces pakalii]|uniref:Uncharacterized protein n=1 Tax=Streptomyces pakalii TaxID=3036494 RepID=A0ABT7D2C6_9ACTN|nr:hypothetical protein [Streptomyces pakalii]MDJ1639955.1 hypothetical protein [Streptomyces pakalii]